MLIHRTQHRLLIGLLLLIMLLLAGAAAAWYRLETEPKTHPAGATLIWLGRPTGA